MFSNVHRVVSVCCRFVQNLFGACVPGIIVVGHTGVGVHRNLLLLLLPSRLLYPPSPYTTRDEYKNEKTKINCVRNRGW